MAAKPESTFTASVHRHLPPTAELYRMKNNNQYVSGIADCWYSAKRDLWVEYKFLIVPKRDSTVIDLVEGGKILSALQQDWLEGRHQEGRNVWVIVGCKEGGVVFKDTAWKQPLTAADFRSRMLARPAVAAALTSFVMGKK